MALVRQPRDQVNKVGLDRLWIGKVVMDTDYPAGGYPLGPLASNSKVKALLWASGGGYQYEFDYDNQKLKVLVPTGNADAAVEAAAGLNALDTVEVELVALID